MEADRQGSEVEVEKGVEEEEEAEAKSVLRSERWDWKAEVGSERKKGREGGL